MKNFALKVVIFVLCVCSIICVTVSFLKPNVMDEIGEQKIWGLVRVREIEEVHEPWDWMLGLETMGALWVDYQEKYLREEDEPIRLDKKRRAGISGVCGLRRRSENMGKSASQILFFGAVEIETV